MKPLTAISFFKSVLKQLPLGIILMAALIMIAGALEGVGFALFLPLIRAFVAGDQTATALPDAAGALGALIDSLSLRTSIPRLLFLIVVVFGLKNLILYVSKMVTEHIATDFEMDLRKRILSSALSSDWTFYLRENMGELVGAVETQSAKSGQGFRLLAELQSEFFNLVVCCVVGFLLSWQTFLLSLTIGGLCLFPMRRIIQLSRKVAAQTVAVRNESYGLIHENFAGIKFIKGNSIENERQSALFRLLDRLKATLIKSHRYFAVIDTLFDFIMALCLSVILYVSYFHFKVPGANILVVAMVLYRLNKIMLGMQVRRQKLTTCVPAYEFCLNILQRALDAKENSGDKVFSGMRSGVTLEKVSFGYDGPEVLSSVSMEIKKDSVTAVVGRSGSGKTTILDLILGLLRPRSGNVLLDGAELQTYDIFSWRKRIGYVPQEPFLVNGTVEDNIRLGNPDVSDEDVREAARLAHADEFIAKMPELYQTLVGDRGVKLSGGQRQRIALARALVRKPDLLILDEATSALDNESERMVRGAIRDLKGNLTILIVAHRYSTIENADIIYVLDAGRIVESGNTESLMGEASHFAKLYRASQQSLSLEET